MSGAKKKTDNNKPRDPFYRKTWFLVVTLIVFPIIGLILLFTVFKDKVGKRAKIAIAVVAIIYVLVRLGSCSSSTSDSATSADSSDSVVATETSSSEESDDTEKSSNVASGDINETLPDGYAYIVPADLQKYGPNMTGVNIYTVAQVSEVDNEKIQITLDPDAGYMMSNFATDADYSSTLKRDDTIAIYGTVSSYDSYGSMGTSINLNGCHVFASGDIAAQYKKDASDENLAQYFTVTSDVAAASGGDVSEDEYKALCTTPDYESVLRNPDQYKDTYVVISGTVDQIIEGLLDTYTIYVTDANGNKWDVSYYYAEGESHVLEGDSITVYGECNGTSNSTTVLGKQVTMPSISGKYIDL